MQRTWVASCGDVYASSSNLNSSDTAEAFFFPLTTLQWGSSWAFQDHLGNSAQISRKGTILGIHQIWARCVNPLSVVRRNLSSMIGGCCSAKLMVRHWTKPKNRTKQTSDNRRYKSNKGKSLKKKEIDNTWQRQSDKEWRGGVSFLSCTFCSGVFGPSWPSPEQGREAQGEARGDSPSTWGSLPPAGALPRLSTCSTKACSWVWRAWSLLVRAPTRGRSARSDSSEIWGTEKEQDLSHSRLLLAAGGSVW